MYIYTVVYHLVQFWCKTWSKGKRYAAKRRRKRLRGQNYSQVTTYVACQRGPAEI